MNFTIYEAITVGEITQAPSPYFDLEQLIQDNPLTIATIEPDLDAFALATFLYRGVTITSPVYSDVANWNDKYLILLEANTVYFCISDEVIDTLTTAQIQQLIDAVRATA